MKTLIITGGMIEADFALSFIQELKPDYILGVDKGLQFCYEYDIRPDYIVGDFDSVPEEVIDYYRKEASVPIREFNPVKDASDTEIALRMCLGLRRKEIWILGGTGNRLDHFWANVQCLNIALEAGSQAMILDSHNRIRLLDHGIAIRREEAFGKYFSVFPMQLPVEDFCISGAKYPLQNHLLSSGDSLCVSNEFAEGEDEVKISFVFGKVILMETRD